MEQKKQEIEEGESLENLEEKSTSEPVHVDKAPEAPKKSLIGKFKSLVSHLNVYFLMFMVIILIGAIIAFVVFNSSQSSKKPTIDTQELTQEAVDDILGSDAKVGDPKQLLTVESDSVFTGKVLIRDGLDVAGPIKVGGSLSLPGITVSGSSAFDDVTINTLNIAGDASVQGQLNISQGLSVSGPVTFSGTFSAAAFAINSLQVDENITLNKHIDAGGPTPGVSAGGGVGSGGTVTISGTDTAGTVTINVGSGAAAGVLATIDFARNFDAAPHVVITPVASQGSPTVTGTSNFYLSSRTSSGFSIATGSALSSGSISFDYIAID